MQHCNEVCFKNYDTNGEFRHSAEILLMLVTELWEDLISSKREGVGGEIEFLVALGGI